MIQVRWQSSDLSILETHPLFPTAASSKTGGTGTTNPPGPTNSPGPANTGDDQQPGDGLSGGVIAAIVVGVVVVLAMVLAAWLFVEYRRLGLELRRRSVADGDQGQSPFLADGKAELPCGADGPPGPPPALANELPDHMAAQAYTPDMYPSEMPGEGVRR